MAGKLAMPVPAFPGCGDEASPPPPRPPLLSPHVTDVDLGLAIRLAGLASALVRLAHDVNVVMIHRLPLLP